MSMVNVESSTNGNGFFSQSETKGKVIRCKAAVVWGPKEPFVLEEVKVDPPQSMEVRIKILYTSICHTDLSAWMGENEKQRAFPRILGHEASGIIESIGEGVKDMKEGDHVVPIFNGECQDCVYCRSDKTNLCEKFRVNPMRTGMGTEGKTRFWTGDDQPIYHFLNTSTFSEFTVIDSACVVKIDSKAPLKMMSLLSCGVSTGVGAAWNAADVKAGSSVAIFGLGAVGLACTGFSALVTCLVLPDIIGLHRDKCYLIAPGKLPDTLPAAEGARSRGASRIIGVDINPEKFIKGGKMGITDFINPRDVEKKSVHEEIKEMTGGGVDYSFECTGNLDVLREAFLSTHDGWGMTVILGIHPTPRMMPFHPMEFFNGRRLVGSVFGDFKGKSQLPQFADDCIRGVVNLDGFITHELPFSKINEAFQLLKEGKSLRCILQL